MSTIRQCFFAKPKSIKEKGCDKPAKHRIIFGDGYTIDVCDTHVEYYKGSGLRIIKLEDA